MDLEVAEFYNRCSMTTEWNCCVGPLDPCDYKSSKTVIKSNKDSEPEDLSSNPTLATLQCEDGYIK